MKSQTWMTDHDLCLTFDRAGRLWRFRPTASAHGKQPVDALEIRGRADRTMHLACDVGIPAPVLLETVTTEYIDGVLFITVPPVKTDAADPLDASLESMPVAV